MLKNLTLFVAASALATAAHASGEPRSRVTSNGYTSPVYFNDGDTFRVLTGPLAGTKARLAGFNTLESFGPVHIWPNLSGRELYVNAKAATMFARRGVWRCTSEMNLDTYGRALFHCPELAIAHIRMGFAHAMTITAESSPPEYLAAQHESQAKRRGMWSKGTPKWILTSIHSLDERPDKKYTYNRVVSSLDGHSEKWRHSTVHPECAKVCLDEIEVDGASFEVLDAKLLSHPSYAAFWAELSPVNRLQVVEVFLSMEGTVSLRVPKELREDFAVFMAEQVETGALTIGARAQGTCMVYTDFRRRFGGGKASCLKLHR